MSNTSLILDDFEAEDGDVGGAGRESRGSADRKGSKAGTPVERKKKSSAMSGKMPPEQQVCRMSSNNPACGI